MIARIAGKLEQVSETQVLLDTGGGLWYEVLIPRCDLEHHSSRLGQEILLHTIHYFEGDPTRGQQQPRLIGFLTEQAREFFRLFTTVKGLGTRKALRALVKPVGQIAAAIGAKDAGLLKALPEIGPRSAERIITELHDKVGDYVEGTYAGAPAQAELSEAAADAVIALIQLGEKRPDARALVERVAAVAPELQTPEEILQHVYRLKAGG
jgi:Holliday junction DNA helicase RuvA